jgi:hypothetical protein
MDGRRLRRVAGLLNARLPELDLEAVPDPRAREGRWSLGQILRATLVGLMAGCHSLWEAEDLTDRLSKPMRKMLGLARRLADTTARDALCRVPLDGLHAALHRLVHTAWRRKALAPEGLPVGVVALDGKATALPCINGLYAQTHHPESGLPYGIVRTVTCSLTSAAGRPCIDAIPIPAKTSEMGHFPTAFGSVLENYGALFQIVTYDAGVLSEANGSTVVDGRKDYLFRLRGEQRTMFKLASELLDPAEVVARTEDHLDSKTIVTRTLVLLPVQPHWSYGKGKGPAESVWRHAQTFLRVESTKTHAAEDVQNEVRFYVSSYPTQGLTPAQWLKVVRGHWGVESSHHTFDTAFAEDDRPWIEADENGMLAVLLLRRIAYTVLALFRATTLRSEEHRTMRWKALLNWVRDVLVAATADIVTDLRLREAYAAAR